MKRVSAAAFSLLAGFIALGFPSLAAAQLLPDGPGKDVFAAVCTNCHSLENVVTLRLSREQWAGLVNDMIARGAPAFDNQHEVITNYLAASFGPEKPPAAQAGSSPGRASGEAGQGPARDLVESSCARCHSLSYVTDARHSREQWAEIVNDMIARGAALRDDEVAMIVQYLADHYGTGNAPAAGGAARGAGDSGQPGPPGLPDGPGKELVATVCTQCHGLNNVVTLRLTAEEWSGLVNDMISRGAPAFDNQHETIIQYLSRNFGK